MYNSTYNYNPYFKQPMYQPIEQPVQPINAQPYVPPVQQNKIVNLLGKSVDSIDVVKAMDIPLDGSVSYFPLTDGSAIVTKQLKADGTSKTIVYKPTEEEKESKPIYVTPEELEKTIKNIDLSEIDDLKDEIDSLRKEIKDLKDMKRGK